MWVGSTPSSTPEKTLHVYIGKYWKAPYIYTWEPESLGIWPGTKLVQDGDWYTGSTTGTNLVINDNSGMQTTNLKLPDWNEIWIVVDNQSNAEFYNYPPEITEVPYTPEYTVVGNADFMGDWDVNSTEGTMTEVDEGVYQVTFPNVQPGDYAFRVVQEHNWSSSWGSENDYYPFHIDELTTITIVFEFGGSYPEIRVEYDYNRLGDFDADGCHSIGEVARLFAHVRNRRLLSDALLPKADTNSDGKINIVDVARLFSAVRKGTLLECIPI